MSNSLPSIHTPTLRQIAQESGVALSTVSVALRGRAGASDRTTKHVREVAERMGWKPNPMVSAWLAHIRQGQSPGQYGTLAYIVNYPQGVEALSHDPLLFVHRAIWKGAKAQAASLGYELEVFNYETYGGARLNKILETRNIQGIILGSHSGSPVAMEFKWSQFSLVSVAYSARNVVVHRAAENHFHVVSLCIDRLNDLGYRRIGLAIPESSNLRCRRMFVGGYYAGLHSLGLAGSISPFVPPDEEFTRERFHAWLKREKPDVVMGLQYIVREWLEELGYHIPDDIGYAHLDLPPQDEPAIRRDDAGIDQQLHRVGSGAIDLLTAQINRNQRGLPAWPKVTMIESEWVDGPTVRQQQPAPGVSRKTSRKYAHH